MQSLEVFAYSNDSKHRKHLTKTYFCENITDECHSKISRKILSLKRTRACLCWEISMQSVTNYLLHLYLLNLGKRRNE